VGMRTAGLHLGLLLLMAAQAAGAGSAAAEPIGTWPLDEGAGQLTADATGRGHDGWLGQVEQPDEHDPAWVPGRFGHALRFDAGQDLFVSIRNPATLTPARVTVEAWVRRLGTPGRWRYVFSSGANECVAAPYGLYSGFDGGLSFYVSRGAEYVRSPEAPPAGVWDGGWHHAVGTFDGTHVRLYLDGLEVASGTPTTLTIGYGPTASGVFIGTYQGSCSRPFTGDIDEVTVHGRALSPQEVAAAAARQAAQPRPPQVPPMAGPPAQRKLTGAQSRRCPTIEVRPRRITAERRSPVLLIARRGQRPAAGLRVAIHGIGLKRTVRTGPTGRVRFVVRAARHGRLRLRALGAPTRCPRQFLKVARMI
jgi:hypothetical protein